jgi:YD repeat-containing protein
MRITFLLIFLCLLACSDDEPTVTKQCKLVKVVSDTPAQTVETTYTYNDEDQIVGQVRTRDGVLDFSYVISYRPDGLVDKVDQGEFTLEHSYTSDGKIQKETVIDDASSQVAQTIDYEWGTKSVEITWQRISRPDPYQTTTHEFSGENIVSTVHRSYNDSDNGKLTSIIEIIYSGFDTGINQYYLASQNRPGYTIVSKNNYSTEVSTHTQYLDGVAQPPSTSTKTYTYEYNESNATVSFVTTDHTAVSSYPTQVTYDDCPE